jgi:plastocyanin
MKIIYGTAFGIASFFAMNCGDGYGGGSSSSPSAQQQPQTGTEPASEQPAAKVNVEGHDFDPPEVHIKAGQTVRWVWVSGSHNVVSGSSCTADGNFTSGASSQGPGSQFDHTFEAKGTFPYYCDPHCGLGMVGKVIVE